MYYVRVICTSITCVDGTASLIEYLHNIVCFVLLMIVVEIGHVLSEPMHFCSIFVEVATPLIASELGMFVSELCSMYHVCGNSFEMKLAITFSIEPGDKIRLYADVETIARIVIMWLVLKNTCVSFRMSF